MISSAGLSHTVTQSSFADPCTPLAANDTTGAPAGFDSSFQAGVQFSINITNDQIRESHYFHIVTLVPILSHIVQRFGSTANCRCTAVLEWLGEENNFVCRHIRLTSREEPSMLRRLVTTPLMPSWPRRWLSAKTSLL